MSRLGDYFLWHRRQRHDPLALIVQARAGGSRVLTARLTKGATPKDLISYVHAGCCFIPGWQWH